MNTKKIERRDRIVRRYIDEGLIFVSTRYSARTKDTKEEFWQYQEEYRQEAIRDFIQKYFHTSKRGYGKGHSFHKKEMRNRRRELEKKITRLYAKDLEEFTYKIQPERYENWQLWYW